MVLPCAGSEVDRNALLFPVPIARRVQLVLFAVGRSRFSKRLRLGHRGRLTEIDRGSRTVRAFHDANMGKVSEHAKY